MKNNSVVFFRRLSSSPEQYLLLKESRMELTSRMFCRLTKKKLGKKCSLHANKLSLIYYTGFLTLNHY